MRLLASILFAVTQAATAAAPPMPYEDHGACPFECCTYRDWVAAARLTAYESHDPRAPKKTAFTIVRGERVTGMTGVVRTTVAGEVLIEKPTTLEVYSVRFPQAKPERITLAAGERVYLLTPHGEGWSSGWYDGRLLESFDAAMFAGRGGCALRSGCTGTVVRQTELEWWVKVRTARGRIGWVLIPRNQSAFTGTSGCSTPLSTNRTPDTAHRLPDSDPYR